DAMSEVRHYTAMYKDDHLYLHETRFGWPARAACRFNPIYQKFRSFVRGGPTDIGPWFRGLHLVNATRTFRGWTEPVYFPLRPIWSGLIIDSTLYAGLLFGAYAFVGFTIRARRMRRGVCVRCQYPVGISPVCTECGMSIPKRGGAAAKEIA
ncbi:MAG: hypothetical protein AABZ53_01695, partial [Planctomycetota bacterium]